MNLDDVGPAFADMANRVVWAHLATVGPDGHPRTRVVHPIWEWDGERLVGWVATVATSIKRAHLGAVPAASVSYWAPNQDTCQADCRASWCFDDDTRLRIWDLFKTTPEPLGYDPGTIPSFVGPTAPDFAVLRLDPYRLRVMPGEVITRRIGTPLRWHEG